MYYSPQLAQFKSIVLTAETNFSLHSTTFTTKSVTPKRSFRLTRKQRLSLPKLQIVKPWVGIQVLFVRAFNRKILTS